MLYLTQYLYQFQLLKERLLSEKSQFLLEIRVIKDSRLLTDRTSMLKDIWEQTIAVIVVNKKKNISTRVLIMMVIITNNGVMKRNTVTRNTMMDITMILRKDREELLVGSTERMICT